ncbi:hypothetical protein [Rariglobus hedericola]|uniref:Uncharacterized protein n=1 Tax=Rariglobus hedericola TaxID=2597822 RepID=A0A556QMP9_9BACT|nr:hypothetical protein [Rariglobus hedericola]TSJ77919.1 hypothetical protein FPL22_01000 [Rariglobus hedericola]
MNNELEITWPRVLRVWWAYLWRSLIAMLVAMILGGIAGFIIGFCMGMAGVPTRTIQFVTAPIGALIGLGISIFPIKMILGKNFGKFRLVLVETSAAEPPALPQS